MQSQNPPALRKYVLGFMVLGVLTLIMLIFVVLQAQANKDDAVTYKAADEASQKLQNYVSSKGSIPTSLSATGVTDAPDSIKYTKVSSSTYKFCVTYKTNSGFSSSEIQTKVLTSAYGGSYGKDGLSGPGSDTTYLYISPNHKKGENCQTVKPYLYSSSLYDYKSDSGSSSSSSSSSSSNGSSADDTSTTDVYAKCDKLYPSSDQDTEYYACIKQGNSTLTN